MVTLTLILTLAACQTPPPAPKPVLFDAALWQAAHEAVDFLPLQHSNPLGGDIETEWGAPAGVKNDRYRVAIVLDYSRITSEAVTVTVQHQIRAGDNWLDAPPETAMAAKFTQTIADRAGELRLAQTPVK